MSEIAGFQEVQETGDPSLLAVSAPDDRTLTVTLQGSPAYFLEEICAGAYTMPLRADVPFYANPIVTNGPYSLTGFTRELVSMGRWPGPPDAATRRRSLPPSPPSRRTRPRPGGG